MLNGTSPIIIIQLAKLAPKLGATIAKLPLVSYVPSLITMPPIPIYLSRELTGIIVLNQDKAIEIGTETETKADGGSPDVTQKGIASTVTVNMMARKDAVGLILLSALSGLIFEKATSAEYQVSYFNGVTSIFGARMVSFKFSETSDDETVAISMELTQGTKTPEVQKPGVTVPRLSTAVPA